MVSPLHPATAILPLIFVLTLSLLREGFEDHGRYKSDKTQNNQPVLVFRNGQDFEEIPSADLKVGDLVKCMEGETFPADLLHLTSSNEGDCYIKTSSLDGEKNLKKRIMCKDLDKIIPKDKIDFNLLKDLRG